MGEKGGEGGHTVAAAVSEMEFHGMGFDDRDGRNKSNQVLLCSK